MVLNDGPIKKAEDLKGGSSPSTGSAPGVDLGMRAYLLQPRPDVQARLHHDRGAVSQHDRGADRPQIRSRHRSAAVRVRCQAATGCAHAVHARRMRWAGRSCRSGWHARASSRSTAPRSSICSRTWCAPIAGTPILPTTRRRSRSWRSSPSSRAARLDWAFTKQDTYRDPERASQPRDAAKQRQYGEGARLHQDRRSTCRNISISA